MMVREVHEAAPVVGLDRVSSLSNVIADVTLDDLVAELADKLTLNTN